MRKLFYLLFALGYQTVCHAQQTQNIYFPDYYSSSVLSYPALINPAFTNNDRDERASLNTLYKSRSGPLNEVAFLTAYADITINPTQNVTQVARILFQNEKEGPYISSPKFYGNYAISVPVREKTSLSLGFALGMGSLSFTAPSGMGSASVLDGSAGGILKHGKTEFGIAAYQIFNNSAVAINSDVIFQRFYHFNIQSELDLDESLSLKGSVFYRTHPLSDILNITGSLCYKDILTIGTMYQFRRGSSFLASIQLNKDTRPFVLNFTYNSLFLGSLLVSTPSIEIGLQYKIRRN